MKQGILSDCPGNNTEISYLKWGQVTDSVVHLSYIFTNSGTLFSKTVRVLNPNDFRYSIAQSYL